MDVLSCKYNQVSCMCCCIIQMETPPHPSSRPPWRDHCQPDSRGGKGSTTNILRGTPPAQNPWAGASKVPATGRGSHICGGGTHTFRFLKSIWTWFTNFQANWSYTICELLGYRFIKYYVERFILLVEGDTGSANTHINPILLLVIIVLHIVTNTKIVLWKYFYTAGFSLHSVFIFYALSEFSID